jgi:hypothetical protein
MWKKGQGNSTNQSTYVADLIDDRLTSQKHFDHTSVAVICRIYEWSPSSSIRAVHHSSRIYQLLCYLRVALAAGDY